MQDTQTKMWIWLGRNSQDKKVKYKLQSDELMNEEDETA